MIIFVFLGIIQLVILAAVVIRLYDIDVKIYILSGRMCFEVLDILMVLKFAQYFMYFKQRKLDSITKRGLLITKTQKFNIRLIPIMSIIYINKALIDALVDPLIFYILTDQVMANAIYQYSVFAGRAIIDFMFALGMLYLFYKMVENH